MDISIVFQIAAVGILVAVINQVLRSAGRDEQAMMTTLAGIIVVMFWIIQHISALFNSITTLFNL
jgi:stage III sporulation protein AC